MMDIEILKFQLFFRHATLAIQVNCVCVLCRSAVRRSVVRNRGLLFFIPGVVLLVAGILLIVSLLSDTKFLVIWKALILADTF